MSSSVPSVPMDPNLGAAQSGAMNDISTQAQYTPQFQQAYYSQASNPYAGQAVQGAQAGGQATQAQGTQNIGTSNMFAGIPGQLTPAIQATLSTAYDPQKALYQSEMQQSTDVTNAGLAQAGLSYTPWAQGVANDANQNFQTNWLQSQLGREQTGAATIAQLLGAGEGAATTGAALGNQGAGQLYTGASMPYNAQTDINANIAQMLPYLTADQQQMAQDYLQYYQAANQNTANAVSAGNANNNYAAQIGQGLGAAASSIGTFVATNPEVLGIGVAA